MIKDEMSKESPPYAVKKVPAVVACQQISVKELISSIKIVKNNSHADFLRIPRLISQRRPFPWSIRKPRVPGVDKKKDKSGVEEKEPKNRADQLGNPFILFNLI